MSIFLKDEFVSPVLGTSSTVFDYNYEDLRTILLNVNRVIKELIAVLRSPKGLVFKNRNLGSTLYKYEFGPLLEEKGAILVDELKRDIEGQISGVKIQDMNFKINETYKTIEVNMTIIVAGKTYIIPTISMRM